MTAIKRVDNECDRNPIEILPASKSPGEGSTERIAKAIAICRVRTAHQPLGLISCRERSTERIAIKRLNKERDRNPVR